jgi:hypothetical protein
MKIKKPICKKKETATTKFYPKKSLSKNKKTKK